MIKQGIDVSVHSVKEITITQQNYAGDLSPEPFKIIRIIIRSEGEHEQTLELSCYTRLQGFSVTKLGGPDDLISRSIKVKHAGP
ncbi:unnamed protein product [marine sediment metagenome]|uniref:Uncharacterized protein n=1 Tax=marine sediment metagenome TaxID=412755 RepID=X0YUW6_9ZZZZ